MAFRIRKLARSACAWTACPEQREGASPYFLMKYITQLAAITTPTKHTQQNAP